MGFRLKKLEFPTGEVLGVLPREELISLVNTCRERIEVYESRLFRASREKYGSKSERSKNDAANETSPEPRPPKPRQDTVKQPSERYPDADVEVEEINFTAPQVCKACGASMQDSGMTEASEYLDVIEKKFIIIEQNRHKHRCGTCHGAIVTAPAPPRVTPRGSYGDGLIVDATLSKFCDLIPMERYSQMAERLGFGRIPPHSLIKATFDLARFLKALYELIREEALSHLVLLADETPHRMLEGDAKKRWYLWSFSNATTCYMECHDTRSGDVSTEILMDARCEYFLSDAYAGYAKSVRLANEARALKGLKPIQIAYCNAHARREFYTGKLEDIELNNNVPADAKWVVEQYAEIYRLNAESKGLSREGILAKRQQMKPFFEAIKADAEKKKDRYSSQSQMWAAYNYFLKYYAGLTLFLENAEIPIDNNQSERLLRSHVVGRKTWYGTHSPRGAAVAATHFTIVESCKLNKVNPREFYLNAIHRIHTGQKLLTPSQYRAECETADDSA